MVRLSSLEDIERLYAGQGGLSYGESITQTEHALQCAALAEAAGAAPSLVVAALLHDVGHLLEQDEMMAEHGLDDRHEFVGAQALKGLFGEAVRGPIALHVRAKRYLCFRQAGYLQSLSPASQTSLDLQGGPFEAMEAEAFERLPYSTDALTLRRFDDLGKREEPCGLCFGDFMPRMRSMLVSGETSAL
jgi:phosphonate degradation associated HDIG domain protein